MSNIFGNLITDDLQKVYQDGVDTLLDPNSGLTVRCRLIYPSTKFSSTTGPNLVGTNSSIGPTGMPIPLLNYNPAEAGAKKTDDVVEEVDMIVNWYTRKELFTQDIKVMNNKAFVQTLAHIDLLPKIKKCQEAIFDLEHEKFNKWRFIRFGVPEFIALFEKRYFIQLWEKAGG